MNEELSRTVLQEKDAADSGDEQPKQIVEVTFEEQIDGLYSDLDSDHE